MQRIQIRAGECLITEEAVRIETSRKVFLKQFAERNPALTALFSLGVLGLLLGYTVVIVSLGVLNQIPDSIFTVALRIATFSGLFLAGSIGTFAAWWWISIKRSQRAGAYPRNLSYENMILCGSIESVTFGRYRNIPVMFIHYRQQNEDVARPVYFRKEAGTEIEKARVAFRSLNIPIERQGANSTVATSV